MTTDDPFFDDLDPERTVIRPMPGRRSGERSEPRSIPEAPAEKRGYVTQAPQPRRVGGGGITAQGSFESMLGRSINPLVDASSSLLVLATQIRKISSHDDVEGLRSFTVQLIEKFEAAAYDSGYSREAVLTARYILCVFVDESVLGTPWGGNSIWGAESLLTTFHNDAWGGEKFFVLLDRLVQQPASHRDLLELFYLCLALGFRGKYGVAQMGLSQLSDIQGNLYRTIVNQHNDFERELSPRWEGVPDKRNVLERYVPLWVVAALAGVLLLVVFAGFRFILHGTSDPVIAELESISKGATSVTQATQNP